MEEVRQPSQPILLSDVRHRSGRTVARRRQGEEKLPRTHNGLIDAFRQLAVQPGHIDRELAADLSRTQSHRIKADYTGIEIEPKEAAETVAKAEVLVQTVERVFALDETSLAAEYKARNTSDDDKVSEPVRTYSNIESEYAHSQPNSLEEMRRQARENWLRSAAADDRGNQGCRPGKVTRPRDKRRSRSFTQEL